MYFHHFRLLEPPFSIAPDPRYFFKSAFHREALEHLKYGVKESGGFTLLTGEVGTGKTTLCRCLLAQLPEDIDIVLILNPRVNALELLATICDELRISYRTNTDSLKVLVDALNEYLLSAHLYGRRTILIIDEAQNLSFEVLEQIRLLTNLETNRTKLLQIILVGQPELNRILKRKDLRQLTHRITCRYHLKPLSFQGTKDYIQHRVSVGGCRSSKLFRAAAVRKIYQITEGVPRLINLLCDRALYTAYLGNQQRVDPNCVRQAAKQVGPALGGPWFLRPMYWVPAVVGVLAVGTLGLYSSGYFDSPSLPHEGIVETVERSPTSFAALEARVAKPHVDSESIQTVGGGVVASKSDEPAIPNISTTEDLKPDKLISADPIAFTEFIGNPALDFGSAFAQLTSQWGIDGGSEGANNCDSLLKTGLRCLSEQNNWFFLRLLNRPAILEFNDSDGVEKYLTLVSVNDYRLTFEGNKQRATFPLEKVLPAWNGKYILFWKPLGMEQFLIRQGQKSDFVWKLRTLLAHPGEAIVKNSKTTYFDEKLENQVITFQMMRGLTPDGVVGPHTLVHLNTAMNDSDIPRLERSSK